MILKTVAFVPGLRIPCDFCSFDVIQEEHVCMLLPLATKWCTSSNTIIVGQQIDSIYFRNTHWLVMQVVHSLDAYYCCCRDVPLDSRQLVPSDLGDNKLLYTAGPGE